MDTRRATSKPRFATIGKNYSVKIQLTIIFFFSLSHEQKVIIAWLMAKSTLSALASPTFKAIVYRNMIDRLACPPDDDHREPVNRVNTSLRLELLRKAMVLSNVKAYIITGEDQHQVFRSQSHNNDIIAHSDVLAIDLTHFSVCIIANWNDFTWKRQTAVYLGFYGQFWDSCRDGQTRRFMDRWTLPSSGWSATGLPVDTDEIRTRSGLNLSFVLC